MKVWYKDNRAELRLVDKGVAGFAGIADNSIDSIVTDPPYHLYSIVKRFGGKDAAPAKFGTDGAFQRASKGFMGKCYHPETELLTEDGWKQITDIVSNRYGGLLYSLNPVTQEIELVKAIDWQQYNYDGELLHFTGRSIDLFVTPNHQLWLSTTLPAHFETANKVTANFSMYNQGVWALGDNPPELTIEDKSYPAKAFMRFLGMYLGDGCVVHRVAQPEKQDFITISAKKERKKKFCSDCLSAMGVKFTQNKKQTYVYDKNLHAFLLPLGHALEKHIPNWIFGLSKELLLELWIGLLNTDGHKGENYDCTQYFTSSRQLADDTQRLLLHCGLSCTLGVKPPKEHPHESYVLSVLQPNKKLWFEQIDHKNKKQRLLKEHYRGAVYDVTLEANHILMTRRNGKTVWSGNSWDGGDVSYDPATWAECLRVLKPGGHMLAFGGSRTFHRIAVAIEDAGFELRDTVMWVYGCLSEDTEILTMDGWVRYDSPLTASPVVCYNSQKNTFEAHLARRKYLYDNKHTAYHIKSDFTDQIVSRNHRVLIERNGERVFDYAENLQEMENIPFLESLHNLPETIYDFYSGTSIQKQDLLGTVQRQADFLAKEGQGETCGTKGLYSDNLCSVREAGVEAQLLSKKSATAEQFDVICEQPASQVVREPRLPLTTLATIKQIEYKGKVWCLEVPTGAFVARRNGQIFITGNSGFPKSHNVSKAIDKMLGAERPVMDTIISKSGGMAHIMKTNKQQGYRPADYYEENGNVIQLTAPATPEAKKWEGWGSSLKPSFEPIILARKPLGMPDVDVVDVIEKSMQASGYKGDFIWIPEGASPAEILSRQKISTSTEQLKTGGASVRVAKENGTPNTENETAKEYKSKPGNGTQQTKNEPMKTEGEMPPNLNRRYLQHTEGSAPVVEREGESFLQLTISTEAAENIAKQSAMCIGTCGKEDTLQDIGFCAGTATVRWGCTDIVHTAIFDGKTYSIRQLITGELIWPKILPKKIFGRNLTVAGNVLKWGTGAINIDGCRVGVKDETQMYVQPRPTTDKGTASWSKGEHTAFHYGTSGGRWPANLLLGWPEDEYELKDNISADNLRQLAGWLDENPKL